MSVLPLNAMKYCFKLFLLDRLFKRCVDKEELIALVEHTLMHVAEIDFIARQALIQSIIQSKGRRTDHQGQPQCNRQIPAKTFCAATFWKE
ncbi:MAG: hypothetical protein ACYDAA_15475 [Syntrophales bacterium]